MDSSPTESTPLVGGRTTTPSPERSSSLTGSSASSGTGKRAPAAWFIVPVFALYYLAYGLIVPSQILIYRLLACSYYWTKHPEVPGYEIFARFPAHSDPYGFPDETCQSVEVKKMTSNITTLVGLIDATFAIISLSMFSTLVGRWGRKTTIILCWISGFVLYCAYCLAAYFRGLLGFAILVVGLIISASAGGQVFGLACSLYVSDLIPAEDRALYFSLFAGLTYGAVSVSMTFGGFLPSWTGLFLSPYLVGLIIAVLCIIGIALFIPESLSEEKRAQLLASTAPPLESTPSPSRPTPPSAAPPSPAPTPVRLTFLQRLSNLNLFKSLAILLPSTQPGRRGWSNTVFILALAIGMSDFALIYSMNLIILTGTNRFKFGPAEMGVVLSMLTCLKAIFLLAIFPTIVVVGRKWYTKRVARQHAATVQQEEEQALITETISPHSSLRGGTHPSRNPSPGSIKSIESDANLFDVFLGCGSLLIDGVTRTSIGLSHSRFSFVLPLAFLCLGGGSRSALVAYATEVVPVEHLDRTLAALTMLQSSLIPISTLAFGALYTLTVEKFPGAPFFLEGATTFCAGLLVLPLLRRGKKEPTAESEVQSEAGYVDVE